MACELGLIRLPPAPRPARTLEEYTRSVDQWSHQCEQAIRQIEKFLHCLQDDVDSIGDTDGGTGSGERGPRASRDRLERKAIPVLKGDKGDKGDPGPTGTAGTNGTNGTNGADGLHGAVSFVYTFSTTTADADPGNGWFRYNNATVASVTEMYIDLTDEDTVTVTAWLDSFDDSTNPTKSLLKLTKISSQTTYAIFKVTTVTTASGYRKLAVTHVSSNGTFSNADRVLVSSVLVGDQGDSVVPLMEVFSSSDTWVVPVGNTRLRFRVWGAGGAGGGEDGVSGDGGGGGAYAEGVYSVTPGDTLTIVVGTGGIAPSSNGGLSSVSDPGGLILDAPGGEGGTTNAEFGGAGGSPGTGQFNVVGQSGMSADNSGRSGNGGDAGAGGAGGRSARFVAPGESGHFPGGGGAGSNLEAGSPGDGADGLVIIEYPG